jgi:hypothetical protein
MLVFLVVMIMTGAYAEMEKEWPGRPRQDDVETSSGVKEHINV